MRYLEILTERPEPQLYYHATPLSNVKSILKQGLLPNHSNEGHGRYEDSRWWSLPGVFCTKSIMLLSNVVDSFMHEPAYVVLSVSVPSTVVDEDAIDNLVQDCWEKECFKVDIPQDDWYELEVYFEDREMNEEDSKELRDYLIRDTAIAFHKLASKANPKAPYDADLIENLVDHWTAFKSADGDADPFEWKALKEKVGRRYPRLEGGNFKDDVSIRIPTAVTFKGRNRIIAIVDGNLNVLYGKAPEQSLAFLKGMVG
jgi:hypothetical protein